MANPPKHLSPESRKFWKEIVDAYDLQPEVLKVLQTACEAWDRMSEARKHIEAEGLLIDAGRYGRRKNPCVDIEQNSRAAFLRAISMINLPEDDKPKPPRVNRKYRSKED